MRTVRSGCRRRSWSSGGLALSRRLVDRLVNIGRRARVGDALAGADRKLDRLDPSYRD